MCQKIVDAVCVRAGQSQIGFDPGFDCAARRSGFEKVRVEALERVKPVMIAGDRINRLREPLEREVELGLIVFDGSGRTDDVRRDHEKLYVIALPKLQIARCKRILRCVAFAGIADYEEAEVAISRSALRMDPKELIARRHRTAHASGLHSIWRAPDRPAARGGS